MEDFSKMTTEELEARAKFLQQEITKLDVEQGAMKILVNSLYGATGAKHFRLYKPECAEAVTSSGQYFIRKVSKQTGDWLGKLSGDNVNKTIYIDTDSVVGSTLVYINGEEMTIEEAFNKGGEVVKADETAKDYVIKPSFSTMSYKDGIAVEKPVSYIMKHRVKKGMFKIRVGGKEVICTADHSLVVLRGGELVEVTPAEVRKGDVFITRKD